MSIERRGQRRGWSVETIIAKKVKQEKRRERTKTVFQKVAAGVADIAISAVPGGSFVGSGIKKVIPAITKIPILDQIIEEADETVQARMQATENTINAVVQEIVPAYEHFQNGDYGKAVVSLAVFAAGVYYALTAAGII